MNLVLISGMINSALYLIGVFIAGIITHNPAAWKIALFTAALCYLSALAQAIIPADSRIYGWVVTGFVAASVAFGAAGGIALLIGG